MPKTWMPLNLWRNTASRRHNPSTIKETPQITSMLSIPHFYHTSLQTPPHLLLHTPMFAYLTTIKNNNANEPLVICNTSDNKSLQYALSVESSFTNPMVHAPTNPMINPPFGLLSIPHWGQAPLSVLWAVLAGPLAASTSTGSWGTMEGPAIVTDCDWTDWTDKPGTWCHRLVTYWGKFWNRPSMC